MEGRNESLFLRRDQKGSSDSEKGDYGLVVPLNEDIQRHNSIDQEEQQQDENDNGNGDRGHHDQDDNNTNNDWEDEASAMGDHASVSIAESQHSSAIIPREWQRLLLTPLLPDDRFVAFGMPVVDGLPAIRLLKFTAFTWMGLMVMFLFVRWMVSVYWTLVVLLLLLWKNTCLLYSTVPPLSWCSNDIISFHVPILF
jgi:hypothetical protein